MEDGGSGDLYLLYHGSQDVWKGEYFRGNCDNKVATIVVIQINDGFIFGGLYDKPWTSYGGYCKSDKAFLFSLNSPSNEVEQSKICINQNMCSNDICHRSSYGQIFGGGHDFYISNYVNNNKNPYYYVRHTYEIPTGQTKTLLAGSRNFKVSDIEVFQIIWQFMFWCDIIAVNNKLLRNSYPS